TRVGVWGISQGGLLAPLVAARVPALAFIVAVSAPGMPIAESAAYQDSMRLVAAGFDPVDLRRAVTIERRLSRWLPHGEDGAELGALRTEAASTPWLRASSLPARLPAGAALAGWYWRGRTLDPAPLWKAVHVPVLALWGAADDLLPARQSARLVERALHQGGHPDVTVWGVPAPHPLPRPRPRRAA